MKEFDLIEDEWYKARDDRTRRVDGSAGFENFSLGILIDSKLESNYSLKIMVSTTLNMLARWCRLATIKIPTSISSHEKINNNILENLEKSLYKIDPYGQFTFGDFDENEFDQVLVIGQPNDTFKKPHVWIDGYGWIAGVGYGSSHLDLQQTNKINPIGPSFASCLGIAEIFRQAIGYPLPKPYSIWHSLFDFDYSLTNPNCLNNPDFNNDLDFGRIYQIGCGAVGSSIDFLFKFTNWKSEIFLIDYDEINISNCNRSLSFNANDAAKKMKKNEVCSEVLNHSNMSPKIFDGTYGDFINQGKISECPADLIICLANENNIWSNIQNNYPPIVFHATTTPNWGVNFGRHIPIKEWCILCRFSQDMEYEFIPQCSESEICSKGEQKETIHGVLPFLSPTSAVLILAEMAKMSMPDYPINKNFLQFSMKSSENNIFQMQRNKNEKSYCYCLKQKYAIFPDKSKFRIFSEKSI